VSHDRLKRGRLATLEQARCSRVALDWDLLRLRIEAGQARSVHTQGSAWGSGCRRVRRSALRKRCVQEPQHHFEDVRGARQALEVRGARKYRELGGGTLTTSPLTSPSQLEEPHHVVQVRRHHSLGSDSPDLGVGPAGEVLVVCPAAPAAGRDMAIWPGIATPLGCRRS
jgi:hypothetical protein